MEKHNSSLSDVIFFRPYINTFRATYDLMFGMMSVSLLSFFLAGLRRSFRLSKKDRRRWNKHDADGENHISSYQEVVPYVRQPEEPYRLVLLVGMFMITVLCCYATHAHDASFYTSYSEFLEGVSSLRQTIYILQHNRVYTNKYATFLQCYN